MGFGMEIAKNAAGGAVGQVMNLAFGGLQDKRQLKQNKKLMEQQMAGQKEMSEFERQQALKTWRDTNYGPQIEEMKKAGMSISGMYDMGGGAGGTTSGGGGGSVSTATAGDPNAGTGMGIQMAQQLALMSAQKENIEADTKKKEVEANKLAGVDTELAGAQKGGIEQQIEQSKAQVNKIAEEIKAIQLNNEITGRTKENQIKIKEEEALTAFITNLVMAEQKSKLHAETNKVNSDIKVNESNIKVNKAKINQMAESILQGWEGLGQGDEKIAIEKFKADLQANYPGMSQALGRGFDDLIYSIWNMRNEGRPQTKGMK